MILYQNVKTNTVLMDNCYLLTLPELLPVLLPTSTGNVYTEKTKGGAGCSNCTWLFIKPS